MMSYIIYFILEPLFLLAKVCILSSVSGRGKKTSREVFLMQSWNLAILLNETQSHFCQHNMKFCFVRQILLRKYKIFDSLKKSNFNSAWVYISVFQYFDIIHIYSYLLSPVKYLWWVFLSNLFSFDNRLSTGIINQVKSNIASRRVWITYGWFHRC